MVEKLTGDLAVVMHRKGRHGKTPIMSRKLGGQQQHARFGFTCLKNPRSCDGSLFIYWRLGISFQCQFGLRVLMSARAMNLMIGLSNTYI